MRIGIDVRLMSHEMTGIGKHIEAVLESLLKIDETNEYFLYGKGDEKINNILQYKNVFYKEISKKLYRSFLYKLQNMIWEQLRLPKAIRQDRIEIFYSPWFNVPLYTLFSSVKTLITIHDVSTLVFPQYFSLIFRLYYNTLIRIAAKKSTVILTVSNNSKKDIIKLLNVANDKIRVVYNISSSNFKVYELEIKHDKIFKKYSIRRPYIFNTGGISERKNTRRLLIAFAQLIKKGFHGDLVLTGKGEFPEAFHKIAEELKITSQLKYIGYVSDEDIVILYNGALATVYPSLYEGFGFPVIESMACGTPVVCSNTSSLPEIAGEAAILFDPYDVNQMAECIYHIIINSDLRFRLRSKGLERAKLFMTDNMGQKVLSVFDSLNN